MKPGYKQTEVGVIPEEWDIAIVSSLLALPIQNGVFNEPSRKGRGFKLINVIDLYGSFPIETKDLERFDANRDEFLRFGVKHGDMFFTRSSLTPDGIAKCNVYSGDGDEQVVFDCHIIRVRPNDRKAEPFFLARYCNSRPARRYLVANAKTTTMTTIDQSVIAKLPVLLPPLPEQRAIATALSDVDGLLGGLDRLIAKKRDLKQAAMQQLLTGQTRLPGFHGEWEVKRLGEVGRFLKGSGVTKDQTRSGTLACVRYGELYTQHNDVVRDFHSWISPGVAATAVLLKPGDILFAGSGETKEEIGKCAAFVSDIEAYAGGDIVILRPDDSDSVFLGYYLNTSSIARQKASRGQGDAVVHISSSALSDVRCRLPPLPEQTAIASVLTEMDAELAVLAQRREKTRALKQAMMQELLTGRIRLVASSGATE